MPISKMKIEINDQKIMPTTKVIGASVIQMKRGDPDRESLGPQPVVNP